MITKEVELTQMSSRKNIIPYRSTIKYAALLFCFALFFSNVQAQKKNKLGIFAPLFLDSVFKNNNYYPYDNKFPRFTLAGLDFVQGVQIALDSLAAEDMLLEVHVYDSKSTTKTIPSMISNNELDSLDMIIGAVKDDEFIQLAQFAQSKQIPFISATYPNDGGVTGNPFLFIANSTLKSHCEAIFGFLLQKHGTDNIILARKSGSQEDKVAGYFYSINHKESKALLDIKTINLDSNIYTIKNKLDSTKKNIIIGGSLEDEFAFSLMNALSPLKKKYDITLIGMPNWDSFNPSGKNKKTAVNDFPFFITSPYFNEKSDSLSKILQNAYLNKYKGNPTDNSFKGFESVYVFSRLINKKSDDFLNTLNSNTFKVFSEYNFMPVFLNKNSRYPDYYENKHLYFIKKLNGISSRAW